MFKLSDGKLFFDANVIPMPFEGVPVDILSWNDLVVVRYEVDHPKDITNNILAFNKNGTIKWSIEPLALGPGDSPNPFMSIRLEAKNLVASAYVGADYLVDYETGNITVKDPNARPW